MTEKRFTLTFDDKIVDNLTGIIHDVHSGYDVAMDLSGLLNELNDESEQLKQQLQEEQCRTTPITLTTHISDDDFKKIELMLKKHFGDLE